MKERMSFIRRKLKPEAEGYFTTEAAMVFPIVLFCVVAVMYFLIFSYDRCLEEIAVGTTALRGCTLQVTRKEELLEQLEKQDVLEKLPYLAWEKGTVEIVLEGNRIRVERQGNLTLPSWNPLGNPGECNWSYMVSYENERIRPVHFIRNYKSIMGGI